MNPEQPFKLHGPLLAFKGEIITLRQALAGGVVKAYLDSATDDVVFIEIDPSRKIASGTRILLPPLTR